jgi:cytochrome c5
MGTTLSMWLGIAFLVIGIAATVLQAWLWSFPMLPDPGGPDPNGTSSAPPFWTKMHRLLGLLFVVIYVFMMWHMIPRLWEYQFELPARTVIHAVMGIVIGCLLIAKISIIRWFQHFGTSLPALGLGIMMCTVVLATLSLPFAMRAHGMNVRVFEPENLSRVQRVLSSSGIEGIDDLKAAELVTQESMHKGRDVLMYKCAICHDMRTVLMKPRSASSWYKLSARMADKPNLGPPLLPEDIPMVTAYLVAISPNLQQAVKGKRADERKKAERAAEAQLAAKKTVVVKDEEPYDKEVAKNLYEDQCTQCHELEDTIDHGPDTVQGWTEVVQQMIVEEEAEITDEQASLIIRYLADTYPKVADAKPAPITAKPEPAPAPTPEEVVAPAAVDEEPAADE